MSIPQYRYCFRFHFTSVHIQYSSCISIRITHDCTLCLFCRNFIFKTFCHNLTYRTNLVVTFFKIDQTNTLGSTTHNTDISNFQTNGDTRFIDNHQVIFISYRLDCYQLTCFSVIFMVFTPLPPRVRFTIVFNFRTFTISLFGNYHYRFCLQIFDTNHSYYFILTIIIQC